MINNLSLIIITWKNPDKLTQTLQSFEEQSLFSLIDDCLLVSQETTDIERRLARKHGLSIVEHKENIGIEGAWRSGLEHAKHNYCLVMENDCPLIEEFETTSEQLSHAITLLSSNRAQVVRLRSRRKPGAKFYNVEKYSRYFTVEGSKCSWLQQAILALRRIIRPYKAKRLIGSSIYAIKNPQERHHSITRIQDDTFLVSSAELNWTNQSVMINKQFMTETLLSRVASHPSSRALNGFQDIERALNCKWWRQQRYVIAVTQGLFTHLE